MKQQDKSKLGRRDFLCKIAAARLAFCAFDQHRCALP